MARLREFLARLHRIIGGSSETELKLFAVTPVRDPSGAAVVTMVTPVAKAPSALRNSRASNSRCSSMAHCPFLEACGHYLSAGDRARADLKCCPRKNSVGEREMSVIVTGAASGIGRATAFR